MRFPKVVYGMPFVNEFEVIAAEFGISQPAVSQVTDGQVQATGGAAPSQSVSGNSTIVPFTGAGVRTAASVGGLLLAFGVAVAAL